MRNQRPTFSKIQTIFSLILLLLLLQATPSFGDTFKDMFRKAQEFSFNYPQEKVFIHTDNASYTQGDTLWYKAYVVLAANNKPTTISKPMYVELLDQLGNVVERQIVEIKNGCASGQIPLTNTLFSGYFELRAYTKWMLSATQPQYFSRVIPIYKKVLAEEGNSRQIAKYTLMGNNNLRPKEENSGLTVRFFPEGGKLVDGLPTQVAFEVFDPDSGFVNTDGVLQDGTASAPIRSIYDGIGTFSYTPKANPATVTVNYKGKQRSFALPEAEPTGVSLSVVNKDSLLEVYVRKNAKTTAGDSSLAIFLMYNSLPMLYKPVAFQDKSEILYKIPTEGLPAGINWVAIVDDKAQVVADRPFFVYPKDAPQLNATTPDSATIMPFHKIIYRLKLEDSKGNALKDVSLSVSVRDAIRSDYQNFAENIASSLLLTSDLKGYIPKPAFYVKDNKPSTRKLLDNLLLVRGWRKYNLSQETSDTTYRPKYLPEHSLELNGRVKSTFSSSQKDIAVTVLSQRDSLFAAGSTVTDDKGYFTLPLNDIEGEVNTLIQTRKQGKNINRYTSVQLFRDFAPTPRLLDAMEERPLWDSVKVDRRKIYQADSTFNASLYKDVITLDEVDVKAKNKNRYRGKDTETFERRLIGFYDAREYIDRQRDKGKEVYEVEDLLEGLNKNVNTVMDSDANFAGGQTGEAQMAIRYGSQPITFYVNGKRYDELFFRKDVDAIKTIMLYEDNNINDNSVYSIGNNFQIKKDKAKDGWTGSDLESKTGVDAVKGGVVCAIQMVDGWDPQKEYTFKRGIRYTKIQGFSRPAAFYSPIYPDPTHAPASDNRRTLYWNPNVMTDSEGQATIECYNANATTVPQLIVNGIADDKPVTTSCINQE